MIVYGANPVYEALRAQPWQVMPSSIQTSTAREGSASGLELCFLQLLVGHHQEVLLANLVPSAAVVALNDVARNSID